jgi:hypothetical protein
MSWLPDAVKELLRYVPTLLWEMVDWGSMTKDVTALSTRLLTGRGRQEAQMHLAPQLPAGLTFGVPTGPPSDALGDTWLELYFRQLLARGPMFLDLRPQHVGGTAGQWRWRPTALWAEFTPSFGAALIKIYDGFYQSSEELFREGLVQAGLLDLTWPTTEQDQMVALFMSHFGQADGKKMRFQLEAFQLSFQKVFTFLAQKKVRLSADVLHLGIMLVTLYMALESFGGEYDVAGAYRRARGQSR